jgi:hypothetical protein
MARADELKQTVRSALPGVEVADDEALVLLVVVGVGPTLLSLKGPAV